MTDTPTYECDLYERGICRLASDLAGADAPTNGSACRFCLGSEAPRGVNQATVSLAYKAADNEARSDLRAMYMRYMFYSKGVSGRTFEGGVGTELKKILAWFSVVEDEGCQCNARANVMDQAGIEWCEKKTRIIVGWLMEAWDARSMSLVDFLPGPIRVVLPPLLGRRTKSRLAEVGARLAVRLAIRKAKQQAARATRQS